MKNYQHVGRWKEGQFPTVQKVLAVVIYDQKYDAYIIDFKDKYDFREWVCGEWFDDYDYLIGNRKIDPVMCPLHEFLMHKDMYIKFTNLGDVAWG